jgi:hypothetical protein
MQKRFIRALKSFVTICREFAKDFKKTEAPPRYNLFSRADRRIYTHSEFGLK